MGYQDNFPGVGISTMAAFGETVTYTPQAPALDAFECLMDVGGVNYSVSDLRNVYRDVRYAKVLHSALVAGGLSAPTAQTEGRTGDTVTIAGVVWTVSPEPGPKLLNEEWMLTLERNIRIVP